MNPTLKEHIKFKSIGIYTLLISIAPPAFAFTLLVLSFWAIAIPTMKSNMLDAKKNLIKEQVNTAYSIMESRYSKFEAGILTEKEMKNQILELTEDLRYDNDRKNYFWISNIDNVILMHPYRKDFINQDMTEYRDAAGKKMFYEMKEVSVKYGEGFITYHWQWHDREGHEIPKISYVKLHNQLGWIIGTGIYIDDIDEAIELITHKANLLFFVLGIVMLFIACLIAIINLSREKRRVEIQNELIDEEENLRIILNSIGDAVIAADLHGRILHMNPAAQNLTGCSLSQVYKQHLTTACKLYDTETGNMIKEPVNSILNDGLLSDSSRHIKFISYDNREFTVSATGKPIINHAKEKIGVVLVFHDNTEEYEVREKLRKSEERFQLAVAGTNNGLWDWDLITDYTFHSDQFATMLGYNPEDLPYTSKAWSDLLHPEDYSMAFQKVSDYLSQKIDTYVSDFRMKTKKDTYRWIRGTGKALYDEEGKAIRFVGFNTDITGIKNTEALLIEGEARIQAIFRAAPTGIGVIINNVFSQVNDVFCKMIGYSESELIGQNTSMVYPTNEETIHADEEKLKQIRLYGTSTVETKFLKKDGKIIEVLMSSTLLEPNNYGKGITFTALDITKRNEITRELVDAKEKAESTKSMLEEKNAIIKFNNNRLESLLKLAQHDSKSTKELLDYALEEAITITKSKIGYIYYYNHINQTFILNTWSKDVMPQCNVDSFPEIYKLQDTGFWGEAVRQSKPIILNDFQAPHPLKKGLPDGHVKMNNFMTIPVFLDGKIVAVAGVANKEGDYDQADINQLTLLMDSVWKMTERISIIESLKKAKERAEQSDRLKSEFINNMSHEIRTPMNGILGFTSMLDKPNLSDEKRNHFIKIIQNSGQQLMRIIDDILEISRLGTKQVEAVNREVCLNNHLLELFSIFDSKAKENSTPLYLHKVLTDKQSTISTDPTKLNKVLSNLIENAIKFTSSGSIEFGYNLIEIENKKHLEIFVKDTGIGIDSDKQELIFERFSQAEKELSQKVGGLGLGLSIAKENAELLNGSIRLESKKNAGSTFFLTIPYEPFFSEEELASESKTDSCTILVVEDEETNFLFLETMLENTEAVNCLVIHAKNGKEAVELVKNNNKVAMIFMDLKMPIMNGYDATRMIRQINSSVPIIAQTAYTSEEDIEQAYQAGCDAFITKPLNRQDLTDVLNKFLKN
jgi:PAS domain S-box-containing protein